MGMKDAIDLAYIHSPRYESEIDPLSAVPVKARAAAEQLYKKMELERTAAKIIASLTDTEIAQIAIRDCRATLECILSCKPEMQGLTEEQEKELWEQIDKMI